MTGEERVEAIWNRLEAAIAWCMAELETSNYELAAVIADWAEAAREEMIAREDDAGGVAS